MVVLFFGILAGSTLWAAPTRSPIAEQAREEKKAELLKKFTERLHFEELKNVRKELIADFERMLDYEFDGSPELQNETFGFAADGLAYGEWFLDRIQHMRAGSASDCSRNGAMASAIDGVLYFCQGYFGSGFFGPDKVTRVSFLIHEARHAEKDNPHLHEPCSYSSDLQDKLPEEDEFYYGACDKDLDGAYAFQTAFLMSIEGNCTNCDKYDRRNAFKNSYHFSGRILSPSVRQNLESKYFGEQALRAAIEDNDLVNARRLFERGIDPTSPKLREHSLLPLHYEVRSAAMIDLIAEFAPNLDWHQRWEDSLAFQSGIEFVATTYDRSEKKIVCNPEAFLHLVERGVNPLLRVPTKEGILRRSALMSTMEHCPRVAFQAIRIIEKQRGSELDWAELNMQADEVGKFVVQCTQSMDSRLLLLQFMKRGMPVDSVLAAIEKGLTENDTCKDTIWARAPFNQLRTILQQAQISRQIAAARRRLGQFPKQSVLEDGALIKTDIVAPVSTAADASPVPASQKQGT